MFVVEGECFIIKPGLRAAVQYVWYVSGAFIMVLSNKEIPSPSLCVFCVILSMSFEIGNGRCVYVYGPSKVLDLAVGRRCGILLFLD